MRSKRCMVLQIQRLLGLSDMNCIRYEPRDQQDPLQT